MTADFGPRTSDLGLRYALRADVALEDFEHGSLALVSGALELREINAPARRVLGLLDGNRTVADIAAELGLPPQAISEALLEMEQQGIVWRVVRLNSERSETMTKAKYLANPEVSFRQEDDDGGLLYNAETDTLEVINPVAVEIWKFLSAPHTQADVAEHLRQACEGVPHDQVAADVAEFFEGMVHKGFIGVIEEPV